MELPRVATGCIVVDIKPRVTVGYVSSLYQTVCLLVKLAVHDALLCICQLGTVTIQPA